jgi:hypothetical protein
VSGLFTGGAHTPVVVAIKCVGVGTIVGVGVGIGTIEVDGEADGVADADAEVVVFAVVDAALEAVGDALFDAWLLLFDDVHPDTSKDADRSKRTAIAIIDLNCIRPVQESELA